MISLDTKDLPATAYAAIFALLTLVNLAIPPASSPRKATLHFLTVSDAYAPNVGWPSYEGSRNLSAFQALQQLRLLAP